LALIDGDLKALPPEFKFGKPPNDDIKKQVFLRHQSENSLAKRETVIGKANKA